MGWGSRIRKKAKDYAGRARNKAKEYGKRAVKKVVEAPKKTFQAIRSGSLKEMGRDVMKRTGVSALKSGNIRDIARSAAASAPLYGRPGPGL